MPVHEISRLTKGLGAIVPKSIEIKQKESLSNTKELGNQRVNTKIQHATSEIQNKKPFTLISYSMGVLAITFFIYALANLN